VIELLTGLLIGSTVALVAVGYVAHRREERRPPTPPPPPPRVQVWMDDRLVYDGPERRTSPRVPLREERGYRWPCLAEEATTDPDDDAPPVVDTVREAMGGMSIDEFESARRIAAKYDPWEEDLKPPVEKAVLNTRRLVGKNQRQVKLGSFDRVALADPEEVKAGMTEGEIEHARRWVGQFPVIEGGMMEVESE